MRSAAPYLALFFAITGTAFAAGPLTGDDIADESLTAADVRNGSLRPSDLDRGEALPRGSRGKAGKPGPVGKVGQPGAVEDENLPLVFADVTADGSGEDFGVKFTHPAKGVYCSDYAQPAWVDVNSHSVEVAQRVAAIANPTGGALAPCPAQTTIRVNVFATGGAAADGPFLIVIGAEV